MSGSHDPRNSSSASSMPTAALRRERKLSPVWLLPLIALLLAGYLGYHAWKQRGTVITVQLPHGHGLKVGDDVRYRGISVGQVRRVTLASDGAGVLLWATLHDQADRLAVAGSRFWVVRPALDLTGASGLETLVGPHYLAVLPGDVEARPQRHFVGLDDPPIIEREQPGDLQIILQAPKRGSLQRGSPLTYRQITVGKVLSVGLASDGSGVEARVHVPKEYRALIRRRSRFWDAGGVQASFGITGGSISVESLEHLVSGGLALATPPLDEAGEIVHTGHRFVLHDEPEEDWLEWKPAVAIGSSLLPAGAPMPHPMLAELTWQQGFLVKGTRARRGWVLLTDAGLLGPDDVLVIEDDDHRATAALEVAGRSMMLPDAPAWTERGLARLSIPLDGPVWTEHRTRAASNPEDCIAVGDPTASPLPLAATRLRGSGTHWTVDPAMPIDATWHGAAVLSRADGKLVGILIVDDDEARVALLP